MLAKIVFSADLHLGYRQYGFKEREEDFYLVMEQIFKRAVADKVTCILLSGDIFDSVKPPAEAVARFQAAVMYARDNKIPVFGIDGNHDSAGSNWLKVCGVYPLSETPIAMHGVKIAGINATRPALLYEALTRMANAGTKVDILAIHQAIGELADFDSQGLTALELAPYLKKLGVKYVAMGDIHKYGELVIGDNKNGIRFVYPDAPEVNALDEGLYKSYSVIVVEDDGSISSQFVPLDTRPIINVTLSDEKVLDTLLVRGGVNVENKKPLVVAWYEPEHRDLAKRAENVLRDKGLMHLIRPLSKTNTIAERMIKQGFERGGALMQLKDAVAAFFLEGSEEYGLVFQFLDNPDNVTEIVKQYMQSKGV